VLRSSGEIALWVREDSVEGISQRILRGFRGRDKVRRMSDFTHRVVTARSEKAEELFVEFKIPKAQEGQCLYMHS
jgi:hypothetical protein